MEWPGKLCFGVLGSPGLLREPNGGSCHRGRLKILQPGLRSFIDARGDLRARLTPLISDLVGIADFLRTDGREDRNPVNPSNDIFQLMLGVRVPGAEGLA